MCCVRPISPSRSVLSTMIGSTFLGFQAGIYICPARDARDWDLHLQRDPPLLSCDLSSLKVGLSNVSYLVGVYCQVCVLCINHPGFLFMTKVAIYLH